MQIYEYYVKLMLTLLEGKPVTTLSMRALM